MSPDDLARLLARLAPGLDALTEPWWVFGSALMVMRGLEGAEAPDLDILTTEAGAAQLEHAWAGWRQGGYAPDPGAPFRSRFSRYALPEGPAELMGGLRCRGALVEIAETEPVWFAGRAWPVPTVAEQLRILRLFGRPKDLAGAARLEAWRDAAPLEALRRGGPPG